MLRQGQRFTMGGRRWMVAYVNASRAHCVTTTRHLVTVHDWRRGTDRSFTADRRITRDISPNSGVDLLSELEQEVSHV